MTKMGQKRPQKCGGPNEGWVEHDTGSDEVGARRKPGGETQETAAHLKVAPVLRLAHSLAVFRLAHSCWILRTCSSDGSGKRSACGDFI